MMENLYSSRYLQVTSKYVDITTSQYYIDTLQILFTCVHLCKTVRFYKKGLNKKKFIFAAVDKNKKRVINVDNNFIEC